VFDLDDFVVANETSADDIEEWDSLKHIRFMITLERALGVKFSNEEIAEQKNVAELVAAAQARGIKAAFVFLPYFEGPAEVQERALYESAGPLFQAHFVSRHDEWFSNVAHLNHDGAVVLSDWLAEKLAPLLKELH